jgi:hypothetical protein
VALFEAKNSFFNPFFPLLFLTSYRKGHSSQGRSHLLVDSFVIPQQIPCWELVHPQTHQCAEVILGFQQFSFGRSQIIQDNFCAPEQYKIHSAGYPEAFIMIPGGVLIKSSVKYQRKTSLSKAQLEPALVFSEITQHQDSGCREQEAKGCPSKLTSPTYIWLVYSRQ